MSLINQMLRDLEKRRADERHGQHSPFKGLISTRGAGVSGLPLSLLGALVVVLSATVGYLVWERAAAPETHAAITPAPTVAPIPVALPPASRPEKVVAALESPARAPAPAPSSTPVPVPASTPAPPARAQPAVIPPRTRTAASPRPQVAAPRAADTAMPVEKTVRALTPRQRAAEAYQRGYAALIDGRKPQAEDMFAEALGHDQGYREAREALAGLWLTTGRWVEARGLLEDGIRLHPDQAVFRIFLSRVRLQQGELKAAAEVLEDGLGQVRPDGDYLATAAALHQRLGDPARSAERYRQALGLDPRHGAWWLGLAIALDGVANGNDAAQAYGRALEAGLEPKLAAYARERLAALGGGKRRP